MMLLFSHVALASGPFLKSLRRTTYHCAPHIGAPVSLISENYRLGIDMDMSTPIPEKTMDMGIGSCKISMLLNWNTIDTCFLSSSFRVRSPAGFLLACLSSFLLVISLEFLRRLQRIHDRYLVSKNTFVSQNWQEVDEMTEDLLVNKEQFAGSLIRLRKIFPSVEVLLGQLARGAIHMIQFALSYVVMLLVMYSNGYIILSILLGALVGFALFTGDMPARDSNIG